MKITDLTPILGKKIRVDLTSRETNSVTESVILSFDGKTEKKRSNK
jgi:hypothetical protein